MIITCDRCDGDFQGIAHSEILPDGIERQFFRCTHCGREIAYAYMDDRIRFLHVLQRAARKRSDKKEVETITKKITDEMNALKKKYEG